MWRRPLALSVSTAALFAASSLVAPDAHANGRFPASNAVFFSPKDPDTQFVRVTFGLLGTRDAGKHWGWVCERAIGFSGLEDPTYVITRDGTIVAGLFEGLRVSRDNGCTWEHVATDGAKVFVDLTMRPSDGAIFALSSSYDKHGDSGILFKSTVWVSTDDAKTFTPIGGTLDPTLLAESLEVSATDPQRVYVSAVRGDETPRQGVLLVSTDGGKKWTERKITSEGKELAPFIAAVDPKKADRVYIRTSASPENPTRLLATDDAGKTWRKILSAKGPLSGFALSSDGAKIHVGGPDDGLFVGAAADAASGKELAAKSKVKVQCLAYGGDRLWACSNEASGFVAGTSNDDGATFQVRLHLADIGGALACPASSGVGKECVGDWGKMRAQLGFMPGDDDAGLGLADGGIGSDASKRDGGAKGPATAGMRADGADPSPERSLARSPLAWLVGLGATAALAWFLIRSRQKR